MAYAHRTIVAPEKSRQEIERLLVKHGALQFGIAVDREQNGARVQFKMRDRHIRFSVNMPAGRIPEAKRSQQERQIWRALLLVIRAKLEAVESRITTFEEEFLAHTVMPDNSTVADMVLPQIAEAYERGVGGVLLLEAPRR